MFGNLKSLLILLFFLPAVLILEPAFAQEGSVHAVLFFSPSCPHCHQVINEDLPPLIDKYGDRLNIIGINTTVPEGQELFLQAVDQFGLDYAGVPMLVIGDVVLIGSVDIPEKFPSIIEEGLAAGGIPWPEIPGLAAIIEASAAQEDPQNQVESPQSDSEENLTTEPVQAPTSGRIAQDPLGNSVAIAVLAAMALSVVWIGYQLVLSNPQGAGDWPQWIVPLLAFCGLIIAGYLSYVEIAQAEAVCGPVGDCNTVQQSPFARLFGVFPIGLLGLVGYTFILATWMIKRLRPADLGVNLDVLIWLSALIGTLFSIYLTFLEPFVIGATCVWCISSAIAMTLLLWATSKPAIQAFKS